MPLSLLVPAPTPTPGNFEAALPPRGQSSFSLPTEETKAGKGLHSLSPSRSAPPRPASPPHLCSCQPNVQVHSDGKGRSPLQSWLQSSEYCKLGDLDASELASSVERLWLPSAMGWGPEELGERGLSQRVILRSLWPLMGRDTPEAWLWTMLGWAQVSLGIFLPQGQSVPYNIITLTT